MILPPRPRPGAASLVRAGQGVPDAPWRFVQSLAQWEDLVERMGSDPLPLAGLWSDGQAIHALLLEGADSPLIASVAVDRNRFLGLSPVRRSAILPERIVRDLWGIEAMAARDLRPWLDHGVWGLTAPLSARPGPASWPPEPPEFVWGQEDEAAGAFQVPIGPVQALTIGPAQMRLTLVGERIRRLEWLAGACHRGVASRLRGMAPEAAIGLVARIDAVGGVAHQVAFARAVEAAAGMVVDRGTGSLRRAIGALERIAMQLHHLARIWSLSGAGGAAGRARGLRARLTEACEAGFGHRLMRGCLAPGGWERLPDPAGLAMLPGVLAGIAAALDPLPDTLPGQDRLAAIERDVDVCRNGLDFGGSLSRCDTTPGGTGEGLAMAESVQGPVWHWVRLDGGTIAAWHAVDPNLEALASVAEAAVGLPADRLGLLCAMRGLSMAGADQ